MVAPEAACQLAADSGEQQLDDESPWPPPRRRPTTAPTPTGGRLRRTARARRRIMALTRERKRRRRGRRRQRRTKSEFHQDNCHGKMGGGRRQTLQGRPTIGDKLALISLLLLASALLQPGPSASISAQPTGFQSVGQEVGEGLSLDDNHQPKANPNQRNGRPAGANQEQLSREQLERIKSESRVEAAVGQNAVLNCAVQFKDGHEKAFAFQWVKYPNKLPIYIWYAGYPPHVAAGYEGRVQRLGQASLNLSRLASSDMGLYECRIYYQDKRPDDRGNSTWIFLDVQAPPHFTQVPAPISYVQAGDSLQLSCQAESTPAPSLRWYKNKAPLEANELQPAFRLSSSSPSPGAPTAGELPAGPQRSQLDLFIDNVQVGSTTGDYKCVASNSEGSVEARAQVLLALPAVISNLPRNQSRQEGQQAEFQCQAKGLPNNITYRWLFNGQPLQQLKWFDARHSVRRDGSLVIHSVHRDDQGEYKCQATNGLAHRLDSQPEVGGTSKTAAPVYAEASAHLEVEYMARVISSPSPQYLPAGLSGLIRCNSQARPPAHLFMWTRNDRFFDHNLDQNIEQLQNGSLLIRQVSRHYEGFYRCTPHNKLGSAGSSGAMEVRVEEPPGFVQKPGDFYKAPANGSVSIPCEGRGRPHPSVTWRRLVSPSTATPKHNQQAAQEQVEVGQTELPASFTANLQQDLQQQQAEQQSVIYDKLPLDRSDFKGGHLLLRGLRKEDHGRYECVVENEVATLVASTMLYVDDTTPHAPTNVRVEPKSWSAQVSWEPGYDGGYEQTFTVWFRQLPNSQREVPKWSSRLPVPVTQAPSLAPAGTVEQQEPLELSWRSLLVPTASPTTTTTTFSLHNLTQDTHYQFYVRAKNYLGESPPSQLVEAHTKRALLGQLTPVTQQQQSSEEPQTEVPAEASVQQNADGQQVFAADGRPTDDEEEDESQGGGPRLPLNGGPTVMGIIHLIDATTSNPQATDSNQPLGGSSDQQANNRSDTNQASASAPADTNPTNKVIRIFFPSGQQQQQAKTNTSANMANLANANGKLAPSSSNVEAQHSKRFDESTESPFTSLEHLQLDPATAPHNLTVVKVAQGWVLNWWPPRRLQEASQPASTSEHLRAASASPEKAAYAVEYRERQGGWLALPETHERSMLLKDLKPGGEYTFRVFALNQAGQRGAASPELRHSIPDNRRKPGSTQALSAGVVSGILFFIACIVIAVCLVNMCNRRRKKRAEKAAYVMMACPVLESHHDLAALNSNSLLKNASGDDGSQGRVSGLVDGGHHLASLLGSFKLRMSHLVSSSGKAQDEKDQEQVPASAQRQIRYTSNPPVPVDVAVLDAPTSARTTSATPLDDYWLHRPKVDRKWGTLTVAASRLAERRAQAAELRRLRSTGDEAEPEVDSLAGELGVRSMAIGELTTDRDHHLLHPGVVGHNKSARSTGFVGGAGAGAGDYVADGAANQSGSRTLPRWFGGGGATAATDHCWPLARLDNGDNNNSQLQNQSRQQQFNCWLRDQLNSGGSGGFRVAPASAGLLQVPVGAFHQQQRPHHYQLQPLHHQLHQRSFSQVEPPTAAAHHWPPPLVGATVLVAPAGLPSHELACQQQQQPSLMVPRNSPHRRTLPLALSGLAQLPHQPHVNNKSPYLATARAGHHQATLSANIAGELGEEGGGGGELGDAPVAVDAKNACLGSYKRKRRLPHIEAQFTIRTPREPPAPRCLQLGDQTKVNDQSERVAIESGQLFVRSLSHHHHRPPPPPPLPPGMPRAGQRREWRRSRPGPPLSQVATIGAREKIETYLRHYDLQQQQENLDYELDDEPLQVNQLEQLTFQPYNNLPSLKYTISLPLSQRSDGTLLLGETSHLRRSGRGSNTVNTQVPSTAPKRRPNTRRLGSSSSCPAPPAEFCGRRDLELSRRSLTECGALNRQPIAVVGNLDHLASQPQPDSLESVGVEATPIGGGGQENVSGNVTGPFYLHTPPPDCSSSATLRDSLLFELPPPPPIPPHRTSTDVQVQTEDEGNESKAEEMTRKGEINSSSSPSCNGSSGSPSNGNESHSEALTNDHSVDENYEFDLISSCSSSIKTKNRAVVKTVATKLDSLDRRQVNNDLYTQVQKLPSPLTSFKNKQVEVKERSHFYDYSSRRKEQPLERSQQVRRQTEIGLGFDLKSSNAARGATTSQDNSLDYYDTVCEEDTNS